MGDVGGITCRCIEWLKGVPFAHSTPYRQPGRDGNGHVGGVTYAEASTLRSTHTIGSKSEERSLLDLAAGLCNDACSISEDVIGGGSVVTSDVWVESFKPVKSTAVDGLPDGDRYVVILEWIVYVPVSGG